MFAFWTTRSSAGRTGLHAGGKLGGNDDGRVDVLVGSFTVALDEPRGLLRARGLHQVDVAVFRETTEHAVDQRSRERPLVDVRHGKRGREVGVADGVEDEPENGRQAQRGDDGEHVHRAVAGALPQVLRRDDQGGPHA